MSRAKKEIMHYVNGSKLLAMEVRISFRLLRKLARGELLIRREQEQLRRTISDLFRLVPFSIFVIVPFMEFALPVFLKLFPNMLPSTFADALREEEKRVKQIKVKIQMATFLKETLKTLSQGQDPPPAIIALFKAYEISKGQDPSSISAQGSTNLFVIPIPTLLALQQEHGAFFQWEALSAQALKSICKYLGLSSWGPSRLLRGRIAKRLALIHTDDLLIMREGGPQALNEAELKAACADRGIGHSATVPLQTLRTQLDQWIQLHCQLSISPALLVLSRALSLHLLSKDNCIEKNAIKPATTSTEPITSLDNLQAEEQLIQQELSQASYEGHTISDLHQNQLAADTLEVLASESAVSQQKAELEELRKEIAQIPPSADKSAQALASEVEHLVEQVGQELSEADAFIGNKLHLIMEREASSKESELDPQEIEKIIQGAVREEWRDRVRAMIEAYEREGGGNWKEFVAELKVMLKKEGVEKSKN